MNDSCNSISSEFGHIPVLTVWLLVEDICGTGGGSGGGGGGGEEEEGIIITKQTKHSKG